MKGHFALIALVFAFFMGAAGAPSPLYEVYQMKWGFSAITLTVIFAVYALFLLFSLLVLGDLSDYIGRRPVLFSSLVLEASSMLVFAGANGTLSLILSRAVQGIATGIATSALSASLFDLQSKEREGIAPLVNTIIPVLGLGVGSTAAGVLLSYGPYPTQLVYWILFSVFAVSAIVILYIPETTSLKAGWRSSIKPSVAVAPEARISFVTVGPSLVAGWALAGLYLSLGPSVATEISHSTTSVAGGMIILFLTSASAFSSFVLRKKANEQLLMIGTITASAGLAVTAYGVVAFSSPSFFAGTLIGGFGIGAAFTGSFRSILRHAKSGSRASLTSAVYTVSYLAFGIPVILAGVSVTMVGLNTTVLAYDLAAIALFLLTVGIFVFRRRFLASRVKTRIEEVPSSGEL